MFDLTHVVDFLFRKKSEYKKLSISDKEKFFFIVNRCFARKYPKHAQFFNKKNIDTSSAMDIWYSFVIKKNMINRPDWWNWGRSKKKKEKYPISNEILQYFVEYYDLKESDIDFLLKNYKDDVLLESKKIKKHIK